MMCVCLCVCNDGFLRARLQEAEAAEASRACLTRGDIFLQAGRGSVAGGLSMWTDASKLLVHVDHVVHVVHVVHVDHVDRCFKVAGPELRDPHLPGFRQGYSTCDMSYQGVRHWPASLACNRLPGPILLHSDGHRFKLGTHGRVCSVPLLSKKGMPHLGDHVVNLQVYELVGRVACLQVWHGQKQGQLRACAQVQMCVILERAV